MFQKQFTGLQSACAFAEAIVATAREPSVVHAHVAFAAKKRLRGLTVIRLKNLAKEALLAVLIAAWIVGLAHQFELWPTTIVYVVISLVMVDVMYGGQLVLRFSPWQKRRR